MEESTLFDTAPVTISASQVRTMIGKVVYDKDMLEFLTVSENKNNSISVKFKSEIVCKIFIGKKTSYIEFKDIDGLPIDTKKVYIDKVDDVLSMSSNYAQWIGASFVKAVLKTQGDSFGCCSRYMKCSDAKKCVHPNFLMSLGCSYKKNLENGRIFYGKNKTI